MRRPLLLLLALMVSLAMPVSAHAQAAGWMDSAWVYRSQVNVTNPNGAPLADFQVRMVLDGSFDYSKAKSGGADLRVTAADGVSQVPFWIEQWDPVHATASIWAKRWASTGTLTPSSAS